jgi:hypothetical protein
MRTSLIVAAAVVLLAAALLAVPAAQVVGQTVPPFTPYPTPLTPYPTPTVGPTPIGCTINWCVPPTPTLGPVTPDRPPVDPTPPDVAPSEPGWQRANYLVFFPIVGGR